MNPPDGAVGQGEIGGLFPASDPPLLLGMIIHLLDVKGGELPQLDAPDGGDDVLFQNNLVAVGSAEPQVGLGVGFVPEPAPFRNSIITSVIDGEPLAVPDRLPKTLPALRLGLGGNAFLHRLPGGRVDAGGVPPLPSSVGPAADAALSICSFLRYIRTSFTVFVTQIATTLFEK